MLSLELNLLKRLLSIERGSAEPTLFLPRLGGMTTGEAGPASAPRRAPYTNICRRVHLGLSVPVDMGRFCLPVRIWEHTELGACHYVSSLCFSSFPSAWAEALPSPGWKGWHQSENEPASGDLARNRSLQRRAHHSHHVGRARPGQNKPQGSMRGQKSMRST